MVSIDRYDFYNVLSLAQWKTGPEIREEVYLAKGIKHPNEVRDFLKKIYFGWTRLNVEGKTYVYLHQLVEEGLAESKKRPPTEEETAMYDEWGLPEDNLLRQGRLVYRKSATGKRAYKMESIGDLEHSLATA